MANIKDNTPSKIRDAMLNWYDGHARALPWRSQPTINPDPYHVWMSEIMLQQTTVGAVKSYFEKFISIWPTVFVLAKADQEDVMKEWAGLGYYSRARNLHKCAKQLVEHHNGVFPRNADLLKTLPGIGDYTAAAISSIAFGIPNIVIDGNVERVVSRLYKIDLPLPKSKPYIREKAALLFVGKNQVRPSCFAQSLMDLGSVTCTPKNPKCVSCPLNTYCAAYKAGEPTKYPLKKPKTNLPEKQGIAYIYIYEGKIGVETRPENGMLGGMIGFPTSEWMVDDLQLKDNVRADLKIRHVFTHFALTLYPVILNKKTDRMIDFHDVDQVGLPTLFKKLWNMIRLEL